MNNNVQPFTFGSFSVGTYSSRLLTYSPASQPRVTVTSCFVYKVIRDLESIDHLCLNTSDISICDSFKGVYMLMFQKTIENKIVGQGLIYGFR